jgi:hypothetical protein
VRIKIFWHNKNTNMCDYLEGRDSLVGIATSYRLDGLGIESRWRRGFPTPSRPALEPTQSPIQKEPCHSRG